MGQLKRLHVAPGCSAAGVLKSALRSVGRYEPVVFLNDDLSWGPINPGDPAQRAKWWDLHPDEGDIASGVEQFWDRLTTTNDELVVWFGLDAAIEHSFYLHLADRLADRSYNIMDVTGVENYWTDENGTRKPRRPAQHLAGMFEQALVPVLDYHRPISELEKENAACQWRLLKEENAPFRIVTPFGLVSAPIDYFDHSLLGRITMEPRKIADVITESMGKHYTPYVQVSYDMLLRRLVTLVKAKSVLASGDPRDTQNCLVWLLEPHPE
jgi:hypothetical protein